MDDSFVEKLENELFCLKYEIKAMSDVLIKGQLERWIPGFSLPHTEVEHLARYEWVEQFVEGKRVLDIACGAGLGSYVLATTGKAKEVFGFDIDPDIIRYASSRRQHPNLVFKVANAEQFEMDSGLDVIINFETIEHLAKPELFLRQAKNLLKDHGELFVSTPISSKPFEENPSNHYHVREWGFTQFQDLVSKYFAIKSIFVQLYPPKKTLLDRIVFKMLNQHKPLYFPKPVLWSPDLIGISKLGSSMTGYQILRCQSV
jgi:2-polyprenyl-3-methyl-5-hydroxy-6-metoxy-1,4-benzoquinol methylase